MYYTYMPIRSDLHGEELVAVKAGGPADALRREAALLEELEHSGIIRFVALTEDERGLRLLTRYAGRETLATWQPQRLEELQRVFEDLTTTICYLHERGVVHRAIRPNHVLIDAMRRPLLCSLSAARWVGTPDDGRTNGESHHSGDGASDHLGDDAGADGATEQAADVAALGETMLAVLDRLDAHGARSGRRRDSQRLRERLRAVAAAAEGGRVRTAKALAGQLQALDGGFGQRPASGAGTAAGAAGNEITAADAAETLRRLRRTPDPQTPGGSHRRSLGRALPGPVHARQPAWLHRRPNRRALLTVAGVCAGCALGVIMVLRLLQADIDTPRTSITGSAGIPDAAPAAHKQRPAPDTDLPPDPAGLASRETISPSTAGTEDSPTGRANTDPPAVAPAPGDDSCRPTAAGYRDTTGDGCAEEIIVGDGFVSVDGAHYPVGEAGDQLAVGDWDCDGVATLALVQEAGRVYVFESWPDEVPLTGNLVADLSPPLLLQDAPQGTCNQLVVHYSEGSWHLPLPQPGRAGPAAGDGRLRR